jgi:hypothetical protein
MFAIGILSLALSFGAQAISIDETDEGYVVDTGSDPSFEVTIDSGCSITSLLYSGDEYQSSETASHIASGIGASVSYDTSGKHSSTMLPQGSG